MVHWETQGPPSIHTHTTSTEPVPPAEEARSTRAKGLKNHVHYKSVERTDDRGVKTLFTIGDPVTVSYDACIDHRVVSRLLLWTEKHVKDGVSSSKARKGKAKAKAPDQRDTINDGIQGGTLYGLLADVYKNEKEHLYVRIQWLYRPRIALYTWKLGAMEKLGLTVANVSPSSIRT